MVLVVEDEALIRMSVSAVLRDAGFEVIEAASAAEAVTALSAHPEVAMHFSDVELPGGPFRSRSVRGSAVLESSALPVGRAAGGAMRG